MLSGSGKAGGRLDRVIDLVTRERRNFFATDRRLAGVNRRKVLHQRNLI